ncbi:alanine dehydrogenase [Neptunomonas japonica]|uniref:Alanine dehydrogenase n=1 Tax=Neptunomonas japonica JAMM 1380 TaxID=1441457 RepID=A0A7R6SX36_9GAMM|nr:alanine dehydrogenase [Neptunomonas japonica]BBB31120.1 alanine dehydrogenase [Neptunomonas japonica JAMM 1380]
MLIGVPKEIKNHEYRIGMTPAGVRELVAAGHQVIVQRDGGTAIGLTNERYEAAGATLIDTAEEIFATAEMIVKVKEPQPNECKMLRSGQILFTYLHLAPDPEQTKLLVDSDAVAIAYETVTDNNGGLPLLAPMSEVAGRMAIQAGAHSLEKAQGGLGTLLGGVPGVAPAKVVVIGGGVVGINAARMAMGLGADVTILDRSLPRLKQLDEVYGPQLKTLYSNVESIEEEVVAADLVVGAVLIPGAAAPKLVTREHLKKMKTGAVVVDVAIDQGGCFETSHATTHQEPTYTVEDVVHYCVANMPGGVARTSTFALTNATLPFVQALANKGYKQALKDDAHLLNGLNVHRGNITYKAVADVLGYAYQAPADAVS